MDTKALEKFAQAARRQLTDQVTARLQLVLHGDSADLRARAEAVAKLRAEIKATSRDAVIVRLGWTFDSGQFDGCQLVSDVLAALPR